MRRTAQGSFSSHATTAQNASQKKQAHRFSCEIRVIGRRIDEKVRSLLPCVDDDAGGGGIQGRMHASRAKMAEGVGFEPTRPFGLTVFKTAAIDHSAIPPGDIFLSAGEGLF